MHDLEVEHAENSATVVQGEIHQGHPTLILQGQQECYTLKRGEIHGFNTVPRKLSSLMVHPMGTSLLSQIQDTE